jgi:serine/threonine protein kinase
VEVSVADLVGKTLANRYQVIEFIGRGGMAEVYKVWDPDRMIYLAAKVLLKSLSTDKVFLRRFRREAESLAKLQHPNIVRYYGLYHDGGIAFMLLDFIEGLNLQEWIFTHGSQLSPDMVMLIAQSVCSALHYAHTEDLVHCDIKPGNIMLNQNNDVLLTDFGIARMKDAATATMVGFGTAAYMAPELVYGKDPTPQSDIYSFGIVLYELVTGGERPFTGEQARTTGTTSEKVRWEQVYLAPPPPSQFKPQLSKQLEAVILRCLAKDPGMRFGSALDLMNAIEMATAGKLSTLNWPKTPANQPTAPPQPVPTYPLISPQSEPIPQSKVNQPPSKSTTTGNKALIPVMAFAGIGIFFLVLVLSLGRNPARQNPNLSQLTGPTSASVNPVGSDDGVSAQAPSSELIPAQAETSTATIPPTQIPASATPELIPTKIPTSTSAIVADITPTPRLYYPLQDCLASQLKVGDSAFISYEGGRNSIRSEPDTNPSNNIIARAEPGEVLLIIGGPICNHGWVLWEVQTTHGIEGWTPETSNGIDFWLLPLTVHQHCEGALPSRLVVGNKAKVNEVPDKANLLRPEPSRGLDHIAKIPPGEWMLVLEGPKCGESTTWWKVQALATGSIGWTMESGFEQRVNIYFLSPKP